MSLVSIFVDGACASPQQVAKGSKLLRCLEFGNPVRRQRLEIDSGKCDHKLTEIAASL